MTTIDADTPQADTTERRPWRAVRGSSFRVAEPKGSVPIIQTDESRFLVAAPFEFDHEPTIDELVERLVVLGSSRAEAEAAVEDARTYVPSDEEPTDLASIPTFMRWFENTYGRHTLAAIIHDRLIRDEPNSGALGSDALADTFFRMMMRDAGVPWLKRWIMWSAVALRSRWAAGGWRRLAIATWLLLALTGISAFVNAVGAAVFDWKSLASPLALAVFSAVLPALSAPLWGKQYRASFIAAVVALWVLPAAVFGLIGFGIYSALERLSRRLGAV